jgi:hypothetical protein
MATVAPLGKKKARKHGTSLGESGIRTHGTVSGSAVFKTAAFSHSAISPGPQVRIHKGLPLSGKSCCPLMNHDLLKVLTGRGRFLVFSEQILSQLADGFAPLTLH